MRLIFMGTGEIGLPSLRSLLANDQHHVLGVVTQPDKPVGRKQVLKPSAIKVCALEASLPVWQPARLRNSEVIDELRRLAPEIIVVMAYGQILSQEVLDLPSIACLNLHASLLPRHRGASPIQSAILAGDQFSGITLMYMNAGLDTGDMLLLRETPIGADETAGELHDRLGRMGPEVLLDGLNLLAQGQAPRVPQDPSMATHCGKLDRDSGWIDWQQSAHTLHNLVRAMNPWPGAFTRLPDGRKWKIHRGIVENGEGQPGEILQANATGILVACGEKSYRLIEVQAEGKGKMSAGDFLRGNPLKPGERLPFLA